MAEVPVEQPLELIQTVSSDKAFQACTTRTENKIGMHQLPECDSYTHLSFGRTCSPPPFICETGTIWYI